MDIFNFDPAYFLGFLLTFLRMSIILFMLPVYSVEGLPAPWKASFCLIITLAIYPSVSLAPEAMPAHPFAIALMILGEDNTWFNFIISYTNIFCRYSSRGRVNCYANGI